MFKKIAIAVNSLAGSGRALAQAKCIVQILESRSVECSLFDTIWPENFSLFSDVWIVGGDGTLNYFINKHKNIDIPLTLFNGGSGNDFFALLYGDCTLNEMIEIGLNNKTVTVDAGICNERYFINGVGIGFEGAITIDLWEKNKNAGKSSYWKSIIKNLFLYSEAEYELSSDSIKLSGEFLLVDIMNGYRAGGGFLIAPGSNPFDGLLKLVLVNKLSWLKRLIYVPVIERGKHLNLPFVSVFDLSDLTIKSSRIVSAHLDGELLESNEFRINLLPKAFKFRSA